MVIGRISTDAIGDKEEIKYSLVAEVSRAQYLPVESSDQIDMLIPPRKVGQK